MTVEFVGAYRQVFREMLGEQGQLLFDRGGALT